MEGYPAEWEFDALLSDGEAVHVRPIRPDDAGALVELHGRLSSETVYRRFFSPHPVLSDKEIHRFTNVDYRDRFALVAVLDGAIAAVARYDRTGEGSSEAEVAFVVEDKHQGRGLGTLLLEHLAAAARERGIDRFVAETLLENRAMLGVFRDAGFPVERSFDAGVVKVSFPVDETGTALIAMEGREHRAEVASMRRFLHPRSIAVVGAGRRPGTIGHEIFRNLIAAGFNGPVYPVNPGATHVAGVRAYPSVADLPDDPDLGVIVVPAPEVAAAVAACGDRGAAGVVVISAGFAEVADADQAGPGDDRGAQAERDLVRIARDRGMRLVGPNCMGVINMAADVTMNATFAPVVPRPGRLGFLSQSGALGIAVLERAASLGLGLSTFVSVGNKADVSGNDLLQYWEADPGTDVVLMYLESFGNPRKFARIARRVSRSKPIVVVKSGRTTGGAKAARSHTAAAASSEVAADALFRQTGVIRVDTLQELFEVALVLSHQPLPAGPRLAVIGNSGGPGILAADACQDAGLELATLEPGTDRRLREVVAGAASYDNPIDLIASATAEEYQEAVGVVLADPNVDAVLVIFTPPLVTRVDDVAAAVVAASAAAPAKPVVAVFLGVSEGPGLLPGGPVPSFPFPEQAVRAVGRVAAYGRWRSRPEPEPKPLEGIDRGIARDIVGRVMSASAEGGWLGATDAAALVAAYGIPVVPSALAATADEAVAAAGTLGYPVVLKAASGDLVHKTDVGGVHLGLASADEVARAFKAMEERLGSAMGGGLVQATAPQGVETIIGVVQDPSFGPLLMFGLGGIATDLLGDRGFRILPVTDEEARELVLSVRSAPLLLGYRGSDPADVDALVDTVCRVGQLAQDIREIAELDLNPVIVGPTGVVVVDTKIRLAPAPVGPGPLLRRLR